MTGCWIWQGAMTDGGYGWFRSGDRRVIAHRAAYEELHGAIPLGYDIHHRCEQRACVNPEHLEALTHADHAARHSPVLSHCGRGHSMDDAYYPPNGADRQCRECRRQRERQRSARVKAARALRPPRVPLPTRGGNTAELRRQAKALRATGLSYHQIADELGASDTSARRWCKHKEA